MLQATDILVPVDFFCMFDKCSEAALAIASPEGDLTLLHVIDEDFLRRLWAPGLVPEKRYNPKCVREPKETLRRRWKIGHGRDGRRANGW